MKNYEEFVNSRLNEEQEFGGNKAAGKLGGMLKKLLGGLVQNVKDEFKKPLDDFNKKLGNTKEQDDMIKVVNDYLKTHKGSLDTSLEETTTPAGLVKTIEDNLRTAYSSIKATVTNFGNDKYTFDELFGDSPDKTKKLMSKNEKNFDKRVNQFAKEMVLSFGKPYGVTEDMLTVEEKTTEQLHDDSNDKLFEMEETATEEEAKDAAEKEEIENTDPEKEGEEGEEKTKSISEDDMKKLKDDVVKWFDNTIYRNVDKKLDELKKEEPKEEGGDLNKVIEDIPNEITQNKDSVKKMVDQLAKTDKQTLIKVRDMLGLDKNEAPI